MNTHDDPLPIGLFTDPATKQAYIIRRGLDNRPHMLPNVAGDYGAAHRVDSSCPCQPTTYRACETPCDDLGLHPADCETCGGTGFVIPKRPFFDTQDDVFYLHHVPSVQFPSVEGYREP